MYLCYIDESGTSSVPGNTSHFVLAGISIPIWRWRDADQEITQVLTRYGLAHAEFHTGWILRWYYEQSKVPNFARLNWEDRRSAVEKLQRAHLLELQRQQKKKAYDQTRKTYRETAPYIHLAHDERRSLARDVADCVGGWGFARLFIEAIDKIHFDPARTGRSVDEQAFEQVLSRFEQYLSRISAPGQQQYGVLVHDNNQTVALKHTQLMRHFHDSGTLWTAISHTIETPLFVDSALTRMIQIADICAYAFRRYHENGETDLMRRLLHRADRHGYVPRAVGVRHFAGLSCVCEVCDAHHRGRWSIPTT